MHLYQVLVVIRYNCLNCDFQMSYLGIGTPFPIAILSLQIVSDVYTTQTSAAISSQTTFHLEYTTLTFLLSDDV